MAAHAAAQAEDFAALVERVRHLGDNFLVVALLAAGLHILRMVHRPEPECMAPMRLDNTVGGDTVAAVTGRTAELLRVVDLQQLLVGMAGEHGLSAHGSLGERDRRSSAV